MTEKIVTENQNLSILLEEQKSTFFWAINILKQYMKYDRNKFSYIGMGDEIWLSFFKSHRYVSNKICATKSNKRLCISR